MIAIQSTEQNLIAKTPSRPHTLNYSGDVWCQSKTISENSRPTSVLRWLEHQVWVKAPLYKHNITYTVSFSIAVSNKKTLVVRTCVLEDMNSQCGTFKFQNDTLKGCLLTCDYDGCNRGHRRNECINIAQRLYKALTEIGTAWHSEPPPSYSELGPQKNPTSIYKTPSRQSDISAFSL